MDSGKRWVIAIALCVVVIFGMQFLFPQKPQPKKIAGADSTQVHDSSAAAKAGVTAGTAATAGAPTANVGTAPANPSVTATTTPTVAAETTEVAPVAARRDSGATFEFGNVGAVPLTVVMNTYANRVSGSNGAKVRLGSAGNPVLKYQLVTNGGSAIDLSGTEFQTARTGDVVTYTAGVGGSTVAINYAIVPDSFVSHVTGSVSGAKTGSYLIVTLPQTFAEGDERPRRPRPTPL